MITFYKVTPVSVLFFRDPRPFNKGEQSLARLQFPPKLTPFLGALRSKFLEEKTKREGKDIPEIFKANKQQIKKISIFWFSLMKDGTPLVPAPCDLYTDWKSLEESRFVTEKVKQNDGYKNPIVPMQKLQKVESLKNAHCLTPEGFVKYKKGQLPSERDYCPFDKLWEFENRVGITLNPDSKTAERSKFYRITAARTKTGVCFLVGIDLGDDFELPEIFSTSFTTRLGGEGHIAVWEKINGFEVSENSGYAGDLVALTHVPIKNNGEPKFKVTNWCINKLDIISGWDYKDRRPKPLVKALKPGAVLLIGRTESSSRQKIYNIKFKDGHNISIVKDLVFSLKNDSPYLADFNPELGEPNTLLIIKN